MNEFIFAFNAISPILLLILIGYLLKQKGYISDSFAEKSNKLIFKFFLPATLFLDIYNIKSITEIPLDTALFSLIMVFILFLLGLAVSVLFVKDNRQKGVVWQTAYRSNFALIGLALAQALCPQSASLVTVLLAFVIVAFNALGVVSLTVFVKDGNGSSGFLTVLKKIAKNPLIIGIFAGIIALCIRYILPTNGDMPVVSFEHNLPFAYSALENLSAMTMPFALLIMGAQFSFQAIKGLRRLIALGTLMRVVVAPIIGISAALAVSSLGWIHFDNVEYAAFVSLFGAPVAIGAAIMAKEMNNDAQLAGQYVVWTSLGSIFSVFGMVVVLRGVGLL